MCSLLVAVAAVAVETAVGGTLVVAAVAAALLRTT